MKWFSEIWAQYINSTDRVNALECRFYWEIPPIPVSQQAGSSLMAESRGAHWRRFIKNHTNHPGACTRCLSGNGVFSLQAGIIKTVERERFMGAAFEILQRQDS
jgi:hypothetical protein